jgi:hypothetical protein
VVGKHGQQAPKAPTDKDPVPLREELEEGKPPNQNSKFRVRKFPSCIPAHSSAINNSPRADVWLAGVFVASLGIVRHLRFQESLKVLNRPGHGTSFGLQLVS